MSALNVCVRFVPLGDLHAMTVYLYDRCHTGFWVPQTRNVRKVRLSHRCGENALVVISVQQN